jgi:ribosomal-protein-alanine N-acetyltransferase
MQLFDERAHLVLLAVRPSHQQRGIGRRLTDWLVASATTAGVASVHVELRAENRAAYALYRKTGFTETLRLQGYYRGRETAIRMMRLLRRPGVVPQAWSPPPRDTK